EAEPAERGSRQAGLQAEQQQQATAQLQDDRRIDQRAGQTMGLDQRVDDRGIGELSRAKQQEIRGETDAADKQHPIRHVDPGGESCQGSRRNVIRHPCLFLQLSTSLGLSSVSSKPNPGETKWHIRSTMRLSLLAPSN